MDVCWLQCATRCLIALVIVRPTWPDVCQTSGINMGEILAHYLEDTFIAMTDLPSQKRNAR
jgi:hypothetical protein